MTVIATDKAGTLTESRMDVRSLDSPDMPRALAALVLANDADLATGAGDPLELGLLRYVASQGVEPALVRSSHEVVSERPFDSAWKFARATVRTEGRPVSYLKGAPEVLIARRALPTAERESWIGQGRGARPRRIPCACAGLGRRGHWWQGSDLGLCPQPAR